MITIGQIGIGYWGPNILRNLVNLSDARVKVCCDLDEEKLATFQRQYPDIRFTSDFNQVMDDPEIEAVVVTTPAVTHYPLAKAALERDKHVFVEKPMALAVEEAEELVAIANARGRTLMVGHLLLYHPAIRKLKSLISDNELGRIYYIYSRRVNLGRVRRDESVMWSLAPHDVSVALYLLDDEPVEVSAQGFAYLQPGVEDIAFLTLRFASGIVYHSHVSWLDPHRERQFVVVGDRKMAALDDTEPAEKLRIYDSGVNVPEYASYTQALTLRMGDILIPRVDTREPLQLECRHFLECVKEGKQPLTDGNNGLRVLRVLDACQQSLKESGKVVNIKSSNGKKFDE
ncbi:MAG TPA: Gfo/Idh/MocA family oxidoreductase [Blastocatellia bacterium]|nr:Gfo/Idh/MocA family oxidoreductase [Blastocatellia bacterium]